MEYIPNYVGITFLACVAAAFGFLYYAISAAAGKESNVPISVATFLVIALFAFSLMALSGYYLNFEDRPPRLILSVMCIVLIMIALFVHPRSRAFIGKMPITTLHYLHIIRVPVEIVLWWLFVAGMVPESMTFEGSNYDILSGISAPFAGLFLVGMKSKSRISAIIWNFLALGLLVNIVFTAIAATPYFYNPPASEVANMAVFYFPYVLLPLFVVPAVFFCHLASLYQLIFIPDEEEN